MPASEKIRIPIGGFENYVAGFHRRGPKGKGAWVSCEVCGTKRWLRPSFLAKGNGRFCSRKCASIVGFFKESGRKGGQAYARSLVVKSALSDTPSRPVPRQLPSWSAGVMDMAERIVPHGLPRYVSREEIVQDLVVSVLESRANFSEKRMSQMATKLIKKQVHLFLSAPLSLDEPHGPNGDYTLSDTLADPTTTDEWADLMSSPDAHH